MGPSTETTTKRLLMVLAGVLTALFGLVAVAAFGIKILLVEGIEYPLAAPCQDMTWTPSPEVRGDGHE